MAEVADDPGVRHELVRWQRGFAEGRSIVSEGRDQGTVVFPDAAVKIFLTASATERARRRLQQFTELGIGTDLETVLAEQAERDARDAVRPVGRLRKAEDAIEINTDGKSVDEVVDEIERIVREKMRHER